MVASTKRRQLTAVIPITKLADKLVNFEVTLEQSKLIGISLVIVHDIQDKETGAQLTTLLRKHDYDDARLIEGYFGSPGAARNAGFDLVETEWVCFWDGDDQPIVDDFAHMVTAASLNQMDIAVGNFSTVDFKTNRFISHSSFADNVEDNLLNIALFPGLWRFAFRTELLKKCLFKNWKLAEDQEYLIQSEFWNHKIQMFDKTVYKYYRNVDGQLTKIYSQPSELESSINLIFTKLSASNSITNSKYLAHFAVKQIITYFKIGSKIPQKIKAIQYFKEIHALIRFDWVSILVSIIKGSRKVRNGKTTVLLQGGLGNNLFQLAAAKSISEERIRVVVWKKDLARVNETLKSIISQNKIEVSGLNSNLIRRLVNLTLRINLNQEKFVFLPIRLVLETFLDTYFSLKFKAKTQLVYGDDIGWSPISRNKNGVFLVGYFQSYKYQSWPSDKRFIESFLHENSKILQLNETLSIKDNPLIVHVRLGDYRNEPDFGIPGVEYYFDAIDKIMSSGSFEKIWLFSDEPNEAIKFIPAQYRNLVRDMSHETNKPQELLAIMRLGSAHVIGNSTFGWWGAFLSKRQGIVIAPNQWFYKLKDPKFLLPNRWLLENPRFEKGSIELSNPVHGERT